MDRSDRFLIVRRAVEFAHAHAAEADRRDCGAVPAKTPLADLEHFLLLFQVLSRPRASATSNGIATRLWRDVAPENIDSSERLTPSALASNLMTAPLAAPPAGASATRTSSSSRPSASVRQPPMPGFAERGVTRIWSTPTIATS